MSYQLSFSQHFKKQLKKLALPERKAALKALKFLAANPKHPSLNTHKVEGAQGDFSKEVFEAYVTKKYRMTWEYGPDKNTISLRNIDNHDECLKKA